MINWSESKMVLYSFWWMCTYSGAQTGHNQIWIFQANFCLEGQGQSTPKAIGILTVFWHLLYEFGGSGLNRWWVIARTNESTIMFSYPMDIIMQLSIPHVSHECLWKSSCSYLSWLPWIFPGATLTFNGAPRNIQGNLPALHAECCHPIMLLVQYVSAPTPELLPRGMWH